MTPILHRLGLPVWMFALVVVYPIPHTIALRNLLLVSGLLVAGGILWRRRGVRRIGDTPLCGSLRLAGTILAALTVWLGLQSAFISPYPTLALGMLRGDWLVALMVAITAACAARIESPSAKGCLLTAITCALFAHVVLLLAYQGYLWFANGQFPIGTTPFAQKDYHSMLVTTLAALVVGELVARFRSDRRTLQLSTRTLVTAGGLTLVANGTLLARNAVLITLLLLLIGVAAWMLHRGRRPSSRTLVTAALALAAIGVAAWLGVQSDTRWQGFSAAVAAGLDRNGSLAWLDGDRHSWPTDAQGHDVEGSAYLRTAWARVAIEQIGANPLGLGYGHKAFGWAVNRAYNVHTGHESSHSGLLDFTLANGIPGLLLWLALGASLAVAGWRTFRDNGSPAGLMLMLTVLGYLARCALDGHLSGWRLEMYALTIGTLIVTMREAERPCG